ncbi:unnamed protein product [Cuscuta campestris]|uniref:Phospholipase/carboxylesterase/thioesterase domain-containing protein n=1 Tax=Cuscuta campestris TaxID=132261 RepID=A0A484MKQ0_9ASTE|nr:unnamed protein product [Cuscuta campestris]
MNSNLSTFLKPAIAFTVTVSFTVLFIVFPRPPATAYPGEADPMARSSSSSFILWLHGLGDSGPANEPIRNLFTSPEFKNTKWSFPSAPNNSVTCNHGAVMPSWFDIHEIPVSASSPKDEGSLLKAVQKVHAMIDNEVTHGTNPKDIFVCGFSQGGALTLASVLLYPKTLGGGAVFSGWVPFNDSALENITPEAKRPVSRLTSGH